MNLTDKVYIDISNIDNMIENLSKEKMSFIENEICSGKYDERLTQLAFDFPLIPLLFISSVFADGDVCIVENIRNVNYPLRERRIKELDDIVDDANKKSIVNDLFDCDIYRPWQLEERAFINIQTKNNKELNFRFFNKAIVIVSAYRYMLEYRSRVEYTKIAIHWLDVINKNKEKFFSKIKESIAKSEEDICF